MSYFFRSAGMINLGLLVGLGFLAKGGRGYCNLLCPIGALDSLANRLGERFGRRFRVVQDRCNGCGLCKEVCPVWAIDVNEKALINHFSCLPCGLCRKACPQQAINYGLKKHVDAKQAQVEPSHVLPNRDGKELAV